MLLAEEETLVLARAVRHGELTETEIPAETGSAPPTGETLRFGKRLDRLMSRGRISEQRILDILREIRTESIATGQTILPNRGAVQRDLGVDATMLPVNESVRFESEVFSSVRAPSDPDNRGGSSPFDSDPASNQSGADRTIDGSLVGYKGPPASTRFPVENWDRYSFEKLLGQGGMGAVYKAKDKRLGREVALKFIRGSDEQMTQRFLQEARAQSRLDHPGICHVYEVGEVEGKAYIAMQFVDGDSLEKAHPSMTLQHKIQVIRDVCLAMHHAHEKGVIHRDLKPSNMYSVEKLPKSSLSSSSGDREV